VNGIKNPKFFVCLDYEFKTTWKILHVDVIQELNIAWLIRLDRFECEISQINILFFLISVGCTRKLKSCYVLDFPAHGNTQAVPVSLTVMKLIIVWLTLIIGLYSESE
jgi:hypothetical protein